MSCSRPSSYGSLTHSCFRYACDSKDSCWYRHRYSFLASNLKLSTKITWWWIHSIQGVPVQSWKQQILRIGKHPNGILNFLWLWRYAQALNSLQDNFMELFMGIFEGKMKLHRIINLLWYWILGAVYEGSMCLFNAF
jgi:hypothetical protein